MSHNTLIPKSFIQSNWDIYINLYALSQAVLLLTIICKTVVIHGPKEGDTLWTICGTNQDITPTALKLASSRDKRSPITAIYISKLLLNPSSSIYRLYLTYTKILLVFVHLRWSRRTFASPPVSTLWCIEFGGRCEHADSHLIDMYRYVESITLLLQTFY